MGDKSFTTDGLNTFFARQLEYITPRLLDQLFAQLRAPLVLPVNSEAGPGADTYTWRSFTMLGEAQFISNYGTDFRLVDIAGEEFTAKIKPLGAAFEYNFQDMRSAILGNLNLEQRRANAAQRIVLNLENKTAFFGAAPQGILGWFNQPNIPTSSVPADGIGNSTLFTQKSPDQVIRDVSTLINAITINTLEVEKADSVLMATSTYTYLKSTRVSVSSDTTILAWLQDAFKDQIKNWGTLVELETAGPGNTRMMIAYEKNPDKIELLIPQPMEQLPVFTDGTIWRVKLHERIGGVITPYPLSNNFASGM